MKNTNKGLSYVEMILVIAISSIVVGLSTMTIGILSRNNAEKAATKLSSALSKAQALSMAKGTYNGCISLVQSDGSYYYYYGSDSAASVKFASSPCTVEVIDDSNNSVPIGTTPIIYYFSSTTGGVDATKPDSCTSYKIKISNKGKTNVYLKIYKTTGKTELVGN